MKHKENIKVYQNPKNRIREGSPVVTAILYAIGVILVFITVYPMYYVLINSISDGLYVMAGRINWKPVGVQFTSYKIIIQDRSLWRAYANTIAYAIAGVAMSLVTTTLMAYGLNHKGLIGRKFLVAFVMIPMFIGGGMIPTFLLYMKLGLYGNPLAIILPGFSIGNAIWLRSYFKTSVPGSLAEAAEIDGAGVMQVLLKIFIPLSKPIYAVLCVYGIVGMWNSWFSALLYLPDQSMQPLQLYLKRVLTERSGGANLDMSPEAQLEANKRQVANASLQYAMIIFTTLPILFTYPYFQKYFVKGMVLGSLKE